MLPAEDVLAAGTVVPRESRAAGRRALALPDGRLRTDLELSAGASEVLLLGAADLLRLELDGADRGVHVAHGDPLSPSPRGTAPPARDDRDLGRANLTTPAARALRRRGPGTVLEVLSREDVTDLWQVRRSGPTPTASCRSCAGIWAAGPA